MSEKKRNLSYICLYYNYLCMIDRLSDEEFGTVIIALIDYAENETMAAFQGSMRGAFLNMVHGIKLDEKKYQKLCGKKGGKRNGT